MVDRNAAIPSRRARARSGDEASLRRNAGRCTRTSARAADDYDFSQKARGPIVFMLIPFLIGQDSLLDIAMGRLGEKITMPLCPPFLRCWWL